MPLIHLALNFPNMDSLDLVRSVLTITPKSIWARDGTGRIPLQRAMEKQVHQKVVDLLWEKLCSSWALDKAGVTPYMPFYELQEGDNVEQWAIYRLQHILTSVRANPEAQDVKTVLEVCPHAITLRDSAGLLPIHYALHAGGNLIDVEVLVEMWPDCLVVADAAGWLPLHWAVFRAAPEAVIKLMLQHGPEASMHGPLLPLHIGLKVNAPVGVFEMLLEEYPEAVQLQPEHGIPTLQWAMRRKMHPQVMPGHSLEYAPIFRGQHVFPESHGTGGGGGGGGGGAGQASAGTSWQLVHQSCQSGVREALVCLRLVWDRVCTCDCM